MQCDKKLYPVLLFSFFPSIARLLQIKITDGSLMPVDKLESANLASALPTINDHLVIVMLGNGFIVTGTLWAAMLYFAMTRKWTASFICSVILAVFSYFGIIHSLYISSKLYLPSSLPLPIQHIPLELACGYLFFGVLTLLLSRLPGNK